MSFATVSAAVASEETAIFAGILRDDLPQTVRLGTIDNRQLEVLGEDGWVTWTAGSCLALVRIGDWTPRSTDLQVTLTDGQILVGDLVDGDPDNLIIDHLWMRELKIPVDQITSVSRRTKSPRTSTNVDSITLVNGDVVSGFVERIANPTVVEIDSGDGESVTIDLDRIAAIDLQADPEDPAWPQIWLTDGSRIHVDSIGFNDAETFTLSRHALMTGAYERFPSVGEVEAVIIGGDSFVPLATCDVSHESVAPIPLPTQPPRQMDPNRPLGMTDIDLRGPVRYHFSLPEDAGRFRGRVERPRRSRGWPAPRIKIARSGSELWSGSVSDQVTLDLPLGGGYGPLVITVEGASHGPIHGGVIIRDGIILRDT